MVENLGFKENRESKEHEEEEEEKAEEKLRVKKRKRKAIGSGSSGKYWFCHCLYCSICAIKRYNKLYFENCVNEVETESVEGFSIFKSSESAEAIVNQENEKIEKKLSQEKKKFYQQQEVLAAFSFLLFSKESFLFALVLLVSA